MEKYVKINESWKKKSIRKFRKSNNLHVLINDFFFLMIDYLNVLFFPFLCVCVRVGFFVFGFCGGGRIFLILLSLKFAKNIFSGQFISLTRWDFLISLWGWKSLRMICSSLKTKKFKKIQKHFSPSIDEVWAKRIKRCMYIYIYIYKVIT